MMPSSLASLADKTWLVYISSKARFGPIQRGKVKVELEVRSGLEQGRAIRASDASHKLGEDVGRADERVDAAVVREDGVAGVGASIAAKVGEDNDAVVAKASRAM